ncbi:hypothetical protein POM88_019945 [Heracleum sosnowskyi]|uniref:Uncharacterized protein n=1 Tax=Heracleum sosnowskyi TaxID=360622 RepID=A0AAD8IE24_9APIA|nr:hypothetical protein POM88_019945 [Heracleum sosnowskyi]
MRTLWLYVGSSKLKEFTKSLNIHLVECSPALQKIQYKKLECLDEDGDSKNVDKKIISALTGSPVSWHTTLEQVPRGGKLFEYLSEHCLDFPVIHHIHFPKGTHRDDLVIGAGTNVGALLVDGLGDGILLEAPDQDFDFLRNTSFNLLQGCRMRNTKTVGIMRVPNSAEKSLKEVMEEIMGDHEMMDFAFVDDDVDGGWMISQ